MAQILKPDFAAGKAALSGGAETNKPQVPVYQLKIDISFTDPLVWRQIQVSGAQSLAELHRILQICLGWGDDHEHQFLVGKVFYKSCRSSDDTSETASRHDDESRVSLQELAEAMKFIFTYIYDAGPGWEGEITLEAVLPGSREYFAPRLLAGAGTVDEAVGSGVATAGLDLDEINLRLAACSSTFRQAGQIFSGGKFTGSKR